MDSPTIDKDTVRVFIDQNKAVSTTLSLITNALDSYLGLFIPQMVKDSITATDHLYESLILYRGAIYTFIFPSIGDKIAAEMYDVAIADLISLKEVLDTLDVSLGKLTITPTVRDLLFIKSYNYGVMTERFNRRLAKL